MQLMSCRPGLGVSQPAAMLAFAASGPVLDSYGFKRTPSSFLESDCQGLLSLQKCLRT